MPSVDDIRLVLKDLDPDNVRIADVTMLLIYIYLLTKNIEKIRIKPIFLLFLPILLKGSHFTGDLASGIYHYVMDTYNIPGLDIFHVNFRKHHNNVMSLETFPMLETISEIMPVGYLPLIGSLLISDIANATENDTLMMANIFSILTNIIMCSAQIAHRFAHRRNHEYNADGVKQFYIPDFVKWLQDNEIILSNKHHSKHHKTEIMNYCISNGSSSPFLDKLIDVFDLTVSTYANTDNVHTAMPREQKRDIMKDYI